jgi:hypothetical protein
MSGKTAPKFGELREGDGEPIDLRQLSKRPWRNRCVQLPGRRNVVQAYCLSMIFSENRYTPRIKSGAGFFGIML